MRKTLPLLLFAALFLASALPVHAQPTESRKIQETQPTSAPEVVWDASFDFFFDNREYDNMKTNWSQSLFGSQITPELGVRFEGRHTLMMGGNFLTEFGTKPFVSNNDLMAYYQYSAPKFKAYGGIVPRRKLIGEYARAFFSDSVDHFHPFVSGLLLQYQGEQGYVEFGCDWNSKLGTETREKFLLFSAGHLNTENELFYAGYNMSMYHHAGTLFIHGVVDNVLLYPFVGINLREQTSCQQLWLQAGWIQAFQNDREVVDKFVSPGGAQIQACVQQWDFGVDNTLYAGKDLMPYFDTYGPALYWGEPFYRTNSIYDRLELYWQPVFSQTVHLRVSSVHHYDGIGWGWQQKVTLSLTLGQKRLLKN